MHVSPLSSLRCPRQPRLPSMRTLARVVDAGHCGWSADEARLLWVVIDVLAAARVAAPLPWCEHLCREQPACRSRIGLVRTELRTGQLVTCVSAVLLLRVLYAAWRQALEQYLRGRPPAPLSAASWIRAEQCAHVPCSMPRRYLSATVASRGSCRIRLPSSCSGVSSTKSLASLLILAPADGCRNLDMALARTFRIVFGVTPNRRASTRAGTPADSAVRTIISSGGIDLSTTRSSSAASLAIIAESTRCPVGSVSPLRRFMRCHCLPGHHPQDALWAT